MKKLILINGDLATGKSHFAVLIRDRFNLPLFTKDEFKEKLAETRPYSTYEESHQLSMMAMDALFDSFKKVGEEGKDLILEANFRAEHMGIIKIISDVYGYQILHLDLVGSPQVLYRRYMKRLRNKKRHPVHKVNNLSNYQSFEPYTLSRRNEPKVGNLITINADNFSYQKDTKLFQQIKNFLEQ